MTRLLASVRDAGEARIALECGADIVDLKEPSAGALGALPVEAVKEIVALVAGARPVSATIGDLPPEPAPLLRAAAAMAATGVDFVKIGFFPGAAGACVQALAPLAREAALVAVLFADRQPDLRLLDALAQAGFRGAMLDTADKRRGGLRDHMDDARLARFVDAAKARGMLTGLAGSLRLVDVEPLAALAPDYLGFRGALCGEAGRGGALDRGALERVRGILAGCVGAHTAAVAPRRGPDSGIGIDLVVGG